MKKIVLAIIDHNRMRKLLGDFYELYHERATNIVCDSIATDGEYPKEIILKIDPKYNIKLKFESIDFFNNEFVFFYEYIGGCL